ncbi:hypothetical protein C1645_875731 [Glomus cerebriforme]|uniref:Uncharacterized protein n=1 Tax=Glomus cerebriforme TaxID=658196 RepID=A0A397T3V8_9GLOM|nr:hypothetical protein C1645_875731 [Glomus cerebriforme]
MEQAGLITLIIISLILSLLSIVHIIRKALFAISIIIHINCLFGSLIILSMNILDLLRVLKVAQLTRDFSSIYFLTTSLTSILSCYVLLQVGINFYQNYGLLKTLSMFAPLIISMGVFGLSVFTAIKILLDTNYTLTGSEIKFKNLIFILSLISGFLSLIYGIFPLFSIRTQTRLRPQQTAVSIVHFFIVVILFIAHFIIYTIVTFKGPILDMDYNSIQNMILILIFPGCLFSPPRGIVKFIKRKFLGVEELAIGGDYRPDMLPDNYTMDNNNSSRRNINNHRLSKSLPPLPPISTSLVISSPTPSPRSTPNSASPRRNESPQPHHNKNIRTHGRSFSHAQIRSQSRTQYHKRSNTTNTMNTINSLNSIESDTSFYISKFFNNSSNGGSSKKYFIGGSLPNGDRQFTMRN